METPTKLNEEEINVCMEALEIWEQAVGLNEVVGDLMYSLVADNASPEELKRIEESKAKMQVKLNHIRRTRKETAIMLKAKLLQIRTEVVRQDIPDRV